MIDHQELELVNGHDRFVQGTRPRPGAGPGTRRPLPARARPTQRRGAFSARDTLSTGLRMEMFLPTLAIGLGTTGSELGQALVARAVRPLGRLPAPFDYLLIDVASRPAGNAGNRYIQIEGGVDGCGTDPKRGRDLFATIPNYALLRSTLSSLIRGLGRPDPLVSVSKSPKEAVELWVLAGCGGTSGGVLHPLITLLHDVALDLNIAEPRIHVVLIGPDISLFDTSRQVIEAQRRIVPDTFVTNLVKLCGDRAADGCLTETRPDGTTFSIRAEQRTYSLTVLDRSNGAYDCATVGELLAMAAEALFARLFTPAAAYVAGRMCDHKVVGPVRTTTPESIGVTP
jgi:hypothetical protein